VKAYEIYGVVDMLADDVEREHDETQYLVKCADNVWRDQSARAVYAIRAAELSDEPDEIMPLFGWGKRPVYS